MFHDITPEMDALVSNWCATLLYGIVIVTFATCIYVLIKRRRDRDSSATWILSGTATIQFILSSLYIAATFGEVIEGFINHENAPNAAYLYFINPKVKLWLIARGVFFTNNTVADCILIWRVYMVWGKNIHICIPLLIMTCGSTVTSYIALGIYCQFTGAAQPTSFFQIANWLLATWSLSIATQVISTGLIAGRIWWHAKQNPVSKSRYVSLIAIIVESGAIFTISTIFLLAFFDLKTQAGGIIADMSSQIVTIVPMLIIIRVEMIRSKTLDTMNNTNNLTDLPRVTTKTRVPLNHSLACASWGPREETPVHIVASTLSISGSEQESKFSV